jgi:hypothetical protein
MTDGGTDAGMAQFGFDQNGLLVSIDDTDNDAGHVVLNHESGTKVSFAIWNTGTAASDATVDIYVDDQYVTQWPSGNIAPGSNEAAEVRGIGRYGTGSHVFRAIAKPGASGYDDVTNTVDIE